jgi:hypothetical protein
VEERSIGVREGGVGVEGIRRGVKVNVRKKNKERSD